MMHRPYYIILLLAFISIIAADDCDYNTPCKCPTGVDNNIHCGGELGTIYGCNYTHVYQCSLTGKICDFGYRKSCAECGALQCNKSVGLTSSSPTPPQPTTVTNSSQIPSINISTSTKYEIATKTETPTDDPTSPQKNLYIGIGIGSGIGGIVF
ncbi:21620_t:CDS:2 [Dentiscutata erythropus]|uniref:21620_t:CDS:1 n=1 Tax=Dentiscutata erythropus TaxID=1348616 RepID=A0A9N9IW70_9GLOM|nr:21620_t:CDS:2 [Dentiscutata erythropus]